MLWAYALLLCVVVLSALLTLQVRSILCILPVVAAAVVTREIRAMDPRGCRLCWDGYAWHLADQGSPLREGAVRCHGRFRAVMWLEFIRADADSPHRSRHLLLLASAVPRDEWRLLRRRLTLLGA